MIALVTGSNGFIGSALCRELLNSGYQVRAFHRASSNTTSLDGLAVEHCLGDLGDRDSITSATKGVDVVFHIAALYRAARFADQEYWKVNFEGTKNLFEVAQQAGVKKVIHCSTTGVLGSVKNPPVDETAPYDPCDVYQESKLAAEKYALEQYKNQFVEGCVIRPAMVWGPGDTRIFKLFKGIAKGILPIVGDGKTWCHWVLVDDLVRAFRIAAEHSDVNGEIFTIAGERPVTLEHTMNTIAKEYGVRLFPFKIPVLPFQLIGDLFELICKPFGIEPPIHRRRADFFIKHRAFKTAKAIERLGYKASLPFEDECRLVANWYVSAGWISTSRKLSQSLVP